MDVSGLTTNFEQAWAWINTHLLTMGSLYQLGVILLLAGVALGIGTMVRRGYESRFKSHLAQGDLLGRLAFAVGRVWWLVIFVALVSFAKIAGSSLDLGVRILDMASSLALAWIVIRFASGVMATGPLRRLVTWCAWTLAALHVVDLLPQVLAFLDSLGGTIGGSHISLLTVFKGILIFALLLRGVSLVNITATSRLARANDLSPSLQALFAKLLKLSLYTGAFLVAVSAVGVDLTSLAFLSGALGVGIGFGLREIFANLVSGVLLLMDRAVKPGDVIELEGGTRGEIKAINIRYSVVRTRDGKEYILPNESLVVNPVVLWTHADPVIRLKIPVGIHYESDPHLAMKLLERAAHEAPRVLDDPKPGARLMGFGDNSVNLELRLWIRDSEKGVVNVQSEVMLVIWDLFKENGVSMPYPQRDIHIKELPDGIAREFAQALKHTTD